MESVTCHSFHMEINKPVSRSHPVFEIEEN